MTVLRRPLAATVLVTIGLVGGVGTFSQARYLWLRHAVAPVSPFHSLGWIVFPAIVLSLAGLYIYYVPSARSVRSLRLLRAAVPLAFAPIACLWQWAEWFYELDRPWPLYLWIAIVALTAWRLGPLLRFPEPSGLLTWTLIAAGFVAIVSIQVQMQYRLWAALAFGYHDIGLHARAIYSELHGRGLFVDSLGWSMLGEHAYFVLYPLAWLCRLGIEPLNLLVFASAIALNGPAFIVAAFLRHRLHSNLAAIVGALAWLLLPSHACLVIERGYGFHPAYLAVPLIAGGMAATLLQRWRWAALCMVAALFVREDVSLVVFAWAVYVGWAQRQRRLGAAFALIAAAYFVVAVFVIIPHFRGAPYPWLSHHYGMEASHDHPATRIVPNASFLVTLLLPMAFLPLRALPIALMALPTLLESLLVRDLELHNLCAHYYSIAIPVLFFAALAFWIRSAESKRRSRSISAPPRDRSSRRLRTGWCLLAAAWMGQNHLSLGPHTHNPLSAMYSPKLADDFAPLMRLRDTVPRTVGVTASYRIATHFLDFDRLWTVRNGNLGDLVVVDDRDDWDGSTPRQALIHAYRSSAYQPVYANYHLVALLRQDEPTPLTHDLHPAQLPRGVAEKAMPLSAEIELAGLQVEQENGAQSLTRVCLYWRCVRPPNGDYRFGLTTRDQKRRWGPFYFARGAYPTIVWRAGELYADVVRISSLTNQQITPDEIVPVLVR